MKSYICTAILSVMLLNHPSHAVYLRKDPVDDITSTTFPKAPNKKLSIA